MEDIGGVEEKVSPPVKIKPLLRRLSSRFKDERVKAIDELTSYGSEIIPILEGEFTIGDELKRRDIIQILGQLGSNEAKSLLIKALEDEDKNVVRAAIWALGRIKATEVLDKLHNMLLLSDGKTKRSIIWTLGQIRDESSLPFLIEQIEDDNDEVIRSTQVALVNFGNKAIDSLLKLLLGEDNSLRLRAVETMTKMKGTDSDQLELKLIELADHQSVKVRRSVAYILGRLGDPNVIDTLTEMLKDDDERVRRNSASALGLIGDKRSVPPLIEALRREGRYKVQKVILKALGKLEDERAIEPLIAFKRECAEEIRESVDKTLASLSHKEISPLALTKDCIIKCSFVPYIVKGLEEIAIKSLRDELGEIDILLQDEGSVIFEYQGDIRKPLSLRSVEDMYLLLGRIKSSDIVQEIEELDWSSIVEIVQSLDRIPTFSIEREGEKALDLSLLREAIEKKFGWNYSLNDRGIKFRIIRLDDVIFLAAKIEIREAVEKYSYRKYLLPASLNPSLAYCMCLIAGIEKSDVFLDPMCGAGTILIERAFAGESKEIIGGDVDPKAVDFAKKNVSLSGKDVKIHRWNAEKIPLPDGYADKVVCNLPYGRRSGIHKDNILLYKQFVRELERLLSNRGKAVLLTQEKRLIKRVLSKHHNLRIKEEIAIEIGGLTPSIFVIV